MVKTLAEIRDELVDREAIRDCLLRYSRGSDRCDEAYLRSIYWPDALDDHLDFSGTADEFVAYCLPVLRSMQSNQHMLGNMLITIQGSKADVETYFQGFHTISHDGKKFDVCAGGRYLDNFERRGQEWRILKRFVVVDWFRAYPDTGDWTNCPLGKRVERGLSSPRDKSYELLKLL